MKHEHIGRGPRQAVNLSLNAELIAEARALGVNLSQASEPAIAAAVKAAREAAWVKDNWDAIQSSNAWVEKHGLPLDAYRMF